jgi:hypothetical protein
VLYRALSLAHRFRAPSLKYPLKAADYSGCDATRTG